MTDLPKSLKDVSDDQLGSLRSKLDQEMQVLRNRKKAIQEEVDRRYTPPSVADHTIGIGA